MKICIDARYVLRANLLNHRCTSTKKESLLQNELFGKHLDKLKENAHYKRDMENDMQNNIHETWTRIK